MKRECLRTDSHCTCMLRPFWIVFFTKAPEIFMFSTAYKNGFNVTDGGISCYFMSAAVCPTNKNAEFKSTFRQILIIIWAGNHVRQQKVKPQGVDVLQSRKFTLQKLRMKIIKNQISKTLQRSCGEAPVFIWWHQLFGSSWCEAGWVYM